MLGRGLHHACPREENTVHRLGEEGGKGINVKVQSRLTGGGVCWSRGFTVPVPGERNAIHIHRSE